MAEREGRLGGKSALVTGAAQGIGEAICRLFLAEGARVLLADIRDELGTSLAGALSAAGGEATYVHLDTTKEDDWERAIDTCRERQGPPDIVVNNAGVGGPSSLIADMTYEDWRFVNSVNLDGVFLGCKHAIRAMRERGTGSIVNISSIFGIVTIARVAAYSASKGGVRLLTKSAALDCAEEGLKVRVNSVHPGFTRTPMVEERLNGGAGREFAEIIRSRTPYGGEPAWPADIAAAVLFLASDDARFITGAELVVDGGVTAQ